MPLFRVTECFIGPGWRENKTKTKVIEKTPDEKRQTVTDCWSGESKNCKNKKLALEMNPPQVKRCALSGVPGLLSLPIIL